MLQALSIQRYSSAASLLEAEWLGDNRRMYTRHLSDSTGLVFDVTGSLRAMEQSFSYVANGGKLVFVGLVKNNISFSDPEFHRREMTLLSSRNATSANFKQVISALEGDKINLSPWITHQVPAEAMSEAFPGWLKPETGVIKAVVEF